MAICVMMFLFLEVWLKRNNPEWTPFLSYGDWLVVTVAPGVNIIMALLILSGIFKGLRYTTKVRFYHSFNLLPTISFIPDAGVIILFPLYGSLALEPKVRGSFP